jgi:imidazolonepropionase-like amidohydrolase
MKRLIATLVLLALPVIHFAQTSQSSDTKSLAFTNVTVIDATGAQPKRDMTVVISGDRITEIGKTGKVKIPQSAQVIDAKGKFLIPGLWDMHVHAFNRDLFFPMLIANGVTGIRDMFGPMPELMKQWRKDMDEGKLVGPRTYIAGPIVDGPKPVWPGSIAVSNAEQGREAVNSLKKRGSDFVKVYSLLPRDAYFAIADEAKKQNIPFAGHVPLLVKAGEASDAGQKSIEHMTGVLEACATAEDELIKEVTELMSGSNQRGGAFRLMSNHAKRMLETYSDTKAKALFARFVKNGTWQVPTIIVLKNVTYIDDPAMGEDPRLKYVPPYFKQGWDPKRDFRFRNRTPESIASQKLTYQKNFELVGAMNRAGVGILAGTDLGNPYVYAGFSLHDELGLLVKAGLTPMQALQAATINPAKYLGILDQIGTIEKGKLADLVLLDADPLKDISNTQKIDSVVLRGRIFAKSDLQEMLARAEAMANSK